ncbi:MAG TPA: DUF3108 domain-containing protein [Gemmatimonadaceae bacterium]
MVRTAVVSAALAGLIGAHALPRAQPLSHAPSQPLAPSAEPRAASVPFRVGEKLSYQAKLNFMSAGSASMSVEGVEDIRGHPTYHTVFDVRGRLLFFHVTDHYESWFDTTSLVSLRYVKHMDESKYSGDFTYDFYPDRKVYVRNGVEFPSVSEPLDEASFIYFMRTVPLDVGKTYQFDRYYHPDRNPVIIQVERKEHIKVPAGEFDAIVVKPIIKAKGLFSQEGDAEVWFSDDSARTLLRLKSKLPFGTLYLELKQAEYASRR